MRCPECDTPNPPENARCKSCGTKMPAVKSKPAPRPNPEEDEDDERASAERVKPRRRPVEEDDDEEEEERRPRRRSVRRRDDDDDDYDDRHDNGEDIVKTLIPVGNPKALVGYYLGFGAIIPGLGLLFAIPGIVLSIMGIRHAKAFPKAKGGGHAIVGLVLSILGLLCNPLLILAVIFLR
jgi:hypothetical protein